MSVVTVVVKTYSCSVRKGDRQDSLGKRLIGVGRRYHGGYREDSRSGNND